MSTGTPVVISRIQNRRGTQAQFDNLYPKEYTSDPGATSLLAVVTVGNTDGLVVGAKPVVINGIGQFVGGTTILSIDSGTQFTVSAEPIVPLSGGATVIHVNQYHGQGGAVGPNILQPGELALCTDTRRLFMGNSNGEYIELVTVGEVTNFVAAPLVLILPPNTVPEVIAPLTHDATPFLSLLYGLVDIVTDDPNAVGLNFSKNGVLQITSTSTDATITDVGTDVNTSALVPNPNPIFPDIQPDISFSVAKVGNSIEISYLHNFTVPLTLSTSSIIWAPLP